MTERLESVRREDDLRIESTRPTWGTVATIIMVIVTALITYAASNNAVDKRISVLETKQDSTQQRLNEINGRLEQLNLKMDQILLNSTTGGR